MTREEMLAYLRQQHSHNECEDCWYSCATICCDPNRRSPFCDCGADQRNAICAEIAESLAAAAEARPLTDWLREHAPDCGDNSCLFGGRGKGGMRTNGGCRCFKDVRPEMKRIFIERLYAALADPSPPRTTEKP